MQASTMCDLHYHDAAAERSGWMISTTLVVPVDNDIRAHLALPGPAHSFRQGTRAAPLYPISSSIVRASGATIAQAEGW
jgi:hypothetical protein